jgi:hypothetical protein
MNYVVFIFKNLYLHFRRRSLGFFISIYFLRSFFTCYDNDTYLFAAVFFQCMCFTPEGQRKERHNSCIGDKTRIW